MYIKFLYRKFLVFEFFTDFKWVDVWVVVGGDVGGVVENYNVVLYGIVNGLEGIDVVLEVNVKVRVFVFWYYGWVKK